MGHTGIINCEFWYLLLVLFILILNSIILCILSKWYKNRKREDVLPNEQAFAERYYTRSKWYKAISIVSSVIVFLVCSTWIISKQIYMFFIISSAFYDSYYTVHTLAIILHLTNCVFGNFFWLALHSQLISCKYIFFFNYYCWFCTISIY